MSATEMIGGVELPAAGTWSIDPGHAEVAFVGRHLGLSKVRGRFAGIEGSMEVAADRSESTVDVTIDMASVLGHAMSHLRTPGPPT